MRKAAVASGVIGVILLAAAGLLAFWITPAYIARLPADSNTTRTYTGTISRMVVPSALASGNFSAAVKTGLTQSIRRQVRVLETSGNSALVEDSSTATANGQPVGVLTERYALDRTSMEATASHPSGWNITNARGLTVSWPIPTGQQNYPGWERYTETTTTLRYVRQEQHAGINTYVFQASTPPLPIKNPQVLHALPTSLPVPVIKRAAAAGLIPQALLANLSKAFPNATSIPLGYTYQAASTYWIDPTTGIIVDLTTTEKEQAGAKVGSAVVPAMPVLEDTYRQSPASVQAVVTDAKNGGGTITTWGMTVPIVFAAVGFVLVVLAVFLAVAGRRPHGAHV